MTITEMKTWFELLQDKSGSQYYTDAEISMFLNRAQIEYVLELLPDNDENRINIELSQETINKIAPLIFELPYTNASTAGVVTKSTVSTALSTLSTGAILWRPLSIGWVYSGKEVPAKYTRHNDRWEFARNYFKRPSFDNPKVRETYNSYIFLPASSLPKIYFTVLKYPKEVNIGTNVSSDMPNITHNRIVAISLEFAGVGSRDVLLSQLLTMQQNVQK